MAEKEGAGGKPQQYDPESGKYTDEETKRLSRHFMQNNGSLRGYTHEQVQPEPAYGFANKERKNTKHHIRHAIEMGFKNQDEYEKAAVDFFNSDKGKLYYSEARRRFYRYDESKKWFVTSSNGIIHTFCIYPKSKFEKIKLQDKLYEW